jgi:rubrerythrin
MSHVIRKIKELHKDETNAPKEYQKLKKIVSLKGSKRAIAQIQKDERRHTKMLNQILSKEKKYDTD